MPKWPENRVKTPSNFIRLLWFTFNHVSLLSFEPFFRDDIYACIYHFRIRLPKTYCISASYADLSPSKNFFSRHLSPDKTRKSHLDCIGIWVFVIILSCLFGRCGKCVGRLCCPLADSIEKGSAESGLSFPKPRTGLWSVHSPLSL